MANDEPIMVMRQGALLTGYAAPRKSNLRQFLETNPVGTKIIWNEKSTDKTRKPLQRPNKSLTLSSRHREQKEKDEKKKQRPIAKIPPMMTKTAPEPTGPFPGTSQTNMYARKEMLEKSREPKKVEKKESKPKPKMDDEGLSGAALLAAVKRGQRRGLMTGKKGDKEAEKEKAKSPGAPPVKKQRLSSEGELMTARRTPESTKRRHPSDPRAVFQASYCTKIKLFSIPLFF